MNEVCVNIHFKRHYISQRFYIIYNAIQKKKIQKRRRIYCINYMLIFMTKKAQTAIRVARFTSHNELGCSKQFLFFILSDARARGAFIVRKKNTFVVHRRDNIHTSCDFTHRDNQRVCISATHRVANIYGEHRQIDALSFMLERRSDCPFTGQ